MEHTMTNLLIAGDFAVRDRLEKSIDCYEFQSVFGLIKPYVERVDYSIVNLECPVATDSYKPILKNGGPLKCGETAVQALKYIGFKCVTLANNHFRDYGNAGCINTIEMLNKYSIAHLGGGVNISESKQPLYFEHNGEQIAVLNFCEHEFSIADEFSGGSCPLDLVENYRMVQIAKEHAKYVIVITHGGHEYFQLPSPRMKQTYRWFIEIGADAVINHHQHCFSGYEVFQGKPIFYGIGNFCFDKPGYRNSIWNEGFLVNLKLGKEIGFDITPYCQCDQTPGVIPLSGNRYDDFMSKISSINAIIQDDNLLAEEFDRWCQSKYKSYDHCLTPYTCKWASLLWEKHLLPSFVPMRKLLVLYNRIACEAHRDVFINYLNHKING